MGAGRHQVGSHPHRRARTGSRLRGQHGAAAVEFALVSVILFPLLLGIVAYGLWFNDSLNARQGVREAARQGVVPTISGTPATASYTAPTSGTYSCSSVTSELQKVACIATGQVAPSSGDVWAKAVVPSGWKRGQPLIVCTMIKESGVTGITPLPNDKIIRASAQLSIEVDTAIPSGAAATGSSNAVWPTSAAPSTWSGTCA
jgi:Flp pilus assembly protein TadG